MKRKFESGAKVKLCEIVKSVDLARRKEKALLTAVTTIAWGINNDDNHNNDDNNQERMKIAMTITTYLTPNMVKQVIRSIEGVAATEY